MSDSYSNRFLEYLLHSKHVSPTIQIAIAECVIRFFCVVHAFT